MEAASHPLPVPILHNPRAKAPEHLTLGILNLKGQSHLKLHFMLNHIVYERSLLCLITGYSQNLLHTISATLLACVVEQ